MLMGEVALTPDEEILIDRSLLMASAKGLFPDHRFEQMFGVTREVVYRVSAAWPKVDLDDRKIRRLVMASLSSLLSYPQIALVETVLGRPPAALANIRGKLLLAGWGLD